MSDTRVVMDRTREPWTVEEMPARGGRRVLRFRHEMGYELATVVDHPLAELEDRQLSRLLEELRRYQPAGGAGARGPEGALGADAA